MSRFSLTCRMTVYSNTPYSTEDTKRRVSKRTTPCSKSLSLSFPTYLLYLATIRCIASLPAT